MLGSSVLTSKSAALALDLLDIADPHGLAQSSAAGDVGVGGNSFAFPFVTLGHWWYQPISS